MLSPAAAICSRAVVRCRSRARPAAGVSLSESQRDLRRSRRRGVRGRLDGHDGVNRRVAHEGCFHGWRAGAAHASFGPNNATDLWHVKKVNPQSMVHLTEKPVELAVRAIQFSSKPGENVLDLFGGSGSTLIGCEQTQRRAFLMELDAPYCDVIVKRWEDFTGRKAERIAAAKPEAQPAEVTA